MSTTKRDDGGDYPRPVKITAVLILVLMVGSLIIEGPRKAAIVFLFSLPTIAVLGVVFAPRWMWSSYR